MAVILGIFLSLLPVIHGQMFWPPDGMAGGMPGGMPGGIPGSDFFSGGDPTANQWDGTNDGSFPFPGRTAQLNSLAAGPNPQNMNSLATGFPNPQDMNSLATGFPNPQNINSFASGFPNPQNMNGLVPRLTSRAGSGQINRAVQNVQSRFQAGFQRGTVFTPISSLSQSFAAGGVGGGGGGGGGTQAPPFGGNGQTPPFGGNGQAASAPWMLNDMGMQDPGGVPGMNIGMNFF